MNAHGIIARDSCVTPVAASGALYRAARILLFILFTAAGAQLAVRLSFTPVPVTVQTLFVVLAGIALGPRDGFYAMLSYLAIGAAGAPVFAGFGFGPAALLGVTGGYLIAFPAAALVSGVLCDRLGGGRAAVLCGTVSGLAIILCSGTLYLALLTGLDFARAAGLGLVPFLGGEALKAAIAVALSGRR
ncbi:MAG TPA: biotin transporter BioY [Patescibacteria group bacterium]|nr:biotin transporter BioY [Patescibacteria group bacterium]